MLYSVLSKICKLIEKTTWNTITPAYLLAAINLLILLLLLGLLLVGRKKLSMPQAAAIAVLTTYLFLVLGGTVVCRWTRAQPAYILKPFWSYIEAFTRRKPTTVGMIVRNCLMLFPMGLLFPICAGKKKKGLLKWVALLSLGVSYAIEFLQLFLKKGTFELVDDPLNNLLGALLGYALCYLLFVRPSRKRDTL